MPSKAIFLIILVMAPQFLATRNHADLFRCKRRCPKGTVCKLQIRPCHKWFCPRPKSTCVPAVHECPNCTDFICPRGTTCTLSNDNDHWDGKHSSCPVRRCDSAPCLTCANVLCIVGTECILEASDAPCGESPICVPISTSTPIVVEPTLPTDP